MNEKEFFENACQPGFGDAMNFQVRREPDVEGTFSKEAIEHMADQLKAFVAARILAQWEKTGQPPRDLFATLRLKFESFPESSLELGLPWSNWVDAADGTSREAAQRWPEDGSVP